VLSKQSLWRYVLLVQYVHQWYSIFWETGCEDYNFEVFANLIYEFAAVRPHIYENIVDSTFDIDWKYDVCIICVIKRTMYKSLVNIKNKSFTPF